MICVVLAERAETGREIQYGVEDLGVEWQCSTALQADQAYALLQTGAEALLLQSPQESPTLLRALTERPLLAPPFVLGLGMDAPDGQLDDLEKLPRMLGDWNAMGRIPALAGRHLPMATDMAAALLRTMETPHRLRAWAFLPEMIALTVVHPPLLTDLRHGLYSIIARRHRMTSAAVERSLRLCVESTWTHGRLEALERFFGFSVDPERGKPTNREFLCRMQERVTLGMQRLM